MYALAHLSLPLVRRALQELRDLARAGALIEEKDVIPRLYAMQQGRIC
jgi:hypothetical protein